MIRIELQIDLTYEIDAGGADFVFNVHAAHTPSQTITGEQLNLSQSVPQRMYTAPESGNRYMYVHAGPGDLKLSYTTTVDLLHHFADPALIHEVPIKDIPPEVMGYIYPSRYCQSDRLIKLANNEFGKLPQGYSRVQAIQDWVKRHVKFTLHSTNSNTRGNASGNSRQHFSLAKQNGMPGDNRQVDAYFHFCSCAVLGLYGNYSRSRSMTE